MLWKSFCCSQIGFGNFVATSAANIVAVLRTLPAIDISASVMGKCCSASPSRRVLTRRERPNTFSNAVGFSCVSEQHSLRMTCDAAVLPLC
jgi:hypothetical protein